MPVEVSAPRGRSPAGPKFGGDMKIASSSASFAQALAEGGLTQLEWLDLCASELELDGVVFDTRHFPRNDDDYFAQLKKTATDLGLTVAGLAAHDALDAGGERRLDEALALGAPIVIVEAPGAREDPSAWAACVGALGPLASAAKSRNVTLALRNAPSTLCASPLDCKRLLKDVDSAWLRVALDAAALGGLDKSDDLIAKTVIATHAVSDTATFATPDDAQARRLLESLRGFRGFVCVDRADENGAPAAFHDAIARLRALAGKADDDRTAVFQPR
jgi:hypothetical protein